MSLLTAGQTKLQVSSEFDWHKLLGNDLLFIFSLIIRLKEPNDQIEKYIDHVQGGIIFAPMKAAFRAYFSDRTYREKKK